MANYANLKSTIQQVVKTNGNNEITGALLQQSLIAMINSLGGYYQFAGIATPSTNPGTPDQNVFYIGGAGTYPNFSSLVIPNGYIGAFKYNGTWTLETAQVGDTNAVKFIAQTLTDIQKAQARTNIDAASNEQVSQLEHEIYGEGGQYNKNYSGSGATINTSFSLGLNTHLGMKVYIKASDNQGQVPSLTILTGKTPSGYWTLGTLPLDNQWHSFDVPDSNVGSSGNLIAQYTRGANTNAGTITLEYSYRNGIKDRLSNVEEKVSTFEVAVSTLNGTVANLEDAKLDKEIGTNLVNPDELESNEALSMNSTVGVPSSVSGNQFKVTGFIPVNGKNIIAKAWEDSTNSWTTMFIYDADKNFLRNNGNNPQYTYQSGDGYVRISFNETQLNNCRANYGTVLADYLPFTDFAPVQELQVQIDELGKETEDSYKASNIIDVGAGYAFTDIQPAINSITDASPTNRYLIRIHDDFNITAVTQLWLMSNPTIHASGINSSCAFIQTKDFVDLTGAGRCVKISVKLPAVEYSSNQQINCHCVYEKGDIRISNIEFESEYTRYTVHKENGSGNLTGPNVKRKKHFKNVVLRYLKGTRYNWALGIGTAPGEECIYENCVIESFAVDGTILDGIGQLHSHPGYLLPFKYTFKNCIISTANFNNSSVYTDIRSGVKPTLVFEDCDFGCILDLRSPTGLRGISLTEKAADWRNGGFYLEGHSNRGVLGRIYPPCLYLETNTNNVDVTVVDDTGVNVDSAYKLLFGDPIVVYPGATDAPGIYLGSQYIINTTDNVWSLRNRLGNCSSVNKSFKVNVDGVEQTVILNLDYSSMQDDADVIADINSKLTGCTLKTNFFYKQLHWGDNTRLVKNTGTQTIKAGSIIADNGSIYGVKLANSGDVAIGIATERINPGATGTMIVKGTQYMQGSGVGYYAVVGTKYKCGDNGILVEDSTDAAQFVCINSAGVFKWIGV